MWVKWKFRLALKYWDWWHQINKLSKKRMLRECLRIAFCLNLRFHYLILELFYWFLICQGSLHSSPEEAARAMNLGYMSYAFHATSGINFKWVVSFLERRQVLWTSLHINIGNNLSQLNHLHAFVLCLAWVFLTNKIISKKLNSVLK